MIGLLAAHLSVCLANLSGQYISQCVSVLLLASHFQGCVLWLYAWQKWDWNRSMMFDKLQRCSCTAARRKQQRRTWTCVHKGLNEQRITLSSSNLCGDCSGQYMNVLAHNTRVTTLDYVRWKAMEWHWRTDSILNLKCWLAGYAGQYVSILYVSSLLSLLCTPDLCI